jgi:hypothetical protein
MAHEDFIHISVGQGYEKIIQQDGVRTTVCENRYEIIAAPTAEVSEQHAVQQLREWVRVRNEKIVRLARDMPEHPVP